MMATLTQPKHVAVMCTNIHVCSVFDRLSPFLYELSSKMMTENLEF